MTSHINRRKREEKRDSNFGIGWEKPDIIFFSITQQELKKNIRSGPIVSRVNTHCFYSISINEKTNGPRHSLINRTTLKSLRTYLFTRILVLLVTYFIFIISLSNLPTTHLNKNPNGEKFRKKREYISLCCQETQTCNRIST